MFKVIVSLIFLTGLVAGAHELVPNQDLNQDQIQEHSNAYEITAPIHEDTSSLIATVEAEILKEAANVQPSTSSREMSSMRSQPVLVDEVDISSPQ